MAKLGFTKLGLKPNNEIKTIEFNGQTIEIKQYLPIEEKLELITNVINFSTDEKNTFTNPIKIKVYMTLEIIEKYTNITFTEKQKENPTKLYDLMNENGLVKIIIDTLPNIEYNEILNGVEESVKAFDSYRNSIMNILDTISNDYNAIDLDLSNIQQKITDPEAIATLKELAQLSGLTDYEK
jgi:hypothetical protein